MKVNVTIQDIQVSRDPISHAIFRQHGKEAKTDRKYIIFCGNERFPRRLPLSAEDFNYRLHIGEAVEPFEFEL
jgi:hypothetical protein